MAKAGLVPALLILRRKINQSVIARAWPRPGLSRRWALKTWLIHVEFQASYDPSLGRRMLRYNVLLSSRHGVPVHSEVVLLAAEADGPAMTGLVESRIGDDPAYLHFRYQVAGGQYLSLATLCDVSTEALPSAIRRMKARLGKEVTRAQANTLWASTYILMGLRYEPDLTNQLLHGVRGMKESSTYQAILAEGKAEGAALEAKRILLRQGTKKFGEPEDSVHKTLEAINELERPEELTDRVLDASSWSELLGHSPRPRRNGSRRKKS
jgi:hypothetical protein